MNKSKHSNATIPLQLKYQRIAGRSLVTAFPKEELAIRVCGSLLGVAVLAYLVLVGMSVLNVIARKEALDQMTVLRTSVGSLERDYFALTEGVTPARSNELGLSPVSNTSYVYRPGAVGVASVRNEI